MKIFKYIYAGFITLIVLIALLLIVSIFPIPGNFRVLAVLSGSMEPAIHTGSVVVISPAKEYRVGDIITFGQISKTATPTTHRVAETKNNKLITKGDANNSRDAKEISPSEVVGKVRLTIPYFGFAVNAAKTPVGFAILIIIPAVIIIYEELKKVWTEIINWRKKKQALKLPPELVSQAEQTKGQGK